MNSEKKEKSTNTEIVICDFCNRNKGVVQDISEGLSIIICKECDDRMKYETRRYIAECTVCGDECVQCSY